MDVLLVAVALLVLGGILSLFTSRSPWICTVLGAGGAVVGCGLGLALALPVLVTGKGTGLVKLAWDVPFGTLALELDPLSALFASTIFLLCGLAALYGGPYLLAQRDHKNLGIPWFFYNLLVAGMVVVVAARNGVLFLAAWEIMALTSFFLVTFEDERGEVREAGRTFLIASHLGTAFLLFFFLVLGQGANSLDFDRIGPVTVPATANLLFLLALVGFGTKAGLMPFHVWLPEAHPAAPSHVSAVMSAVMIKMGIYGLVRALTFLPAPPSWWGGLLIGMGIVSGVWGILFALAQHDLKRLLAYSTVENAGIIALGLGIGLLGLSLGQGVLAVLGFAGALLHVLNHSLFKGLLFLGAGVVLHSAGTRDINTLGGLSKRLPWVGAAFFVGVLAAAGLPPFNGFSGEFLLYLAGFKGLSLVPQTAAAFLGTIAALALIGGLAAVGLAKAFGIVFLGEPRGEAASRAHAPSAWMTGPLVILACACLVVGLSAPAIASYLMPAVGQLVPFPTEVVGYQVIEPLGFVVLGSLVLLLLLATLVLLRRFLLSRREVGQTVTWGCGYIQPTPRMQYTGSSFVQPVLDFFAPFLRTHKQLVPPQGLFPAEAEIATRTDDLPKERFYRPVFSGVGWLLSRLRWLQHGYVHLYLLYVGLTLVVLLVWYASK